MSAVHTHAELLLARELRRRRALLAFLPQSRRSEVEAAIARAVLAAADAVVEQGRTDAALAAALRATYGSAEDAAAGPVAAAGD